MKGYFENPWLFFIRIYAFFVFKMTPLRKSVFQCWDKNQPEFCRFNCWKEQPVIFIAYLINHNFQTSVLINSW